MAQPPSDTVSATRIRLLVFNLPVMLSELLHKRLESVADIEVVEWVGSARQISSQIHSEDIVLLGSSSTNSVHRAVDILESLRDHGIKVIVLCDKPDYEETISLFRAGAKGIVSAAELEFDLLCKSVRCVHGGQLWANNELLKHLVTFLSAPQSKEITDSLGRRLLTKREQQVLHLLADGLSNADLALKLKVSEHTIKNHLFRIYEKLGVSNRMEAVLYALNPRVSVREEKPRAIVSVDAKVADERSLRRKLA